MSRKRALMRQKKHQARTVSEKPKTVLKPKVKKVKKATAVK